MLQIFYKERKYQNKNAILLPDSVLYVCFFIYIISFIISFYVIWHFDIKKFLITKQQWLSYLIMLVLSSALAFAVGSFFSIITIILHYTVSF
ncbi:hypothetical protein JTY60_00165 [symbiont of Argiope bruennichi]|uniref:hypothetical protein n=1 Tax=symbiont of Argiope bruennichi TaxID=2810479 RepID=UPI003DA22D96